MENHQLLSKVRYKCLRESLTLLEEAPIEEDLDNSDEDIEEYFEDEDEDEDEDEGKDKGQN